MFKFIRRLRHSLTIEENRSDLHSLVTSLDPSLPFEERIEALKKIMQWMRLPVTLNQNEALIEGFGARNIRFKFFLQFLERNDEAAKFFLATFQEVTSKGSAVRLFCLTGIPENSGFISELIDRITLKLLPPIGREKDLAELFSLVFEEEEDAEWFEHHSQKVIAPFIELLRKHDTSTSGLIQDQSDALIILGAQVSALGISKQVRRHLNYKHISDSSFFKLGMAINRGLPEGQILSVVSQVREDLEEVRTGLEASGVSVDLIHLLEKLNSLLGRIEMIIESRLAGDTLLLGNFIGRLIRDELRSLGVKEFIYQNLHLLTRKIVERAGDKGDTYIATTPKEKSQLFVAASWAGVLTAFTAIIKYWIGAGQFPLFIEGFLFFANYAVGFLLMQKWHLALSSKQPAYTASALSKKFESFLKTKELSPIIIEVQKVYVSQLIATAANLAWVIPIAILLDTLWLWTSGGHIVDYLPAKDILEKHSLWNSLSVPYAAFTGILLWLSSVVAGWTENWIVFRGIPTLLNESRFLKASFGKQGVQKIAEALPGAMAGIAGNLSISLFLASPIILGKLTGIPLDIRHVTLAAGTLSLGLSSIGWSLEHWPIYLEMIFSVIIIGVLNFGVSFYCALRMAALARDVNSKYLKIIFRFAFKKPRVENTESP